jgi:hypothetical protein
MPCNGINSARLRMHRLASYVLWPPIVTGRNCRVRMILRRCGKTRKLKISLEVSELLIKGRPRQFFAANMALVGFFQNFLIGLVAY